MNRIHGGPDARGCARWDFSTCSHPQGPCPEALLAVQIADPRTYPDPQYRALRERLAALHGVAAERVLLAASASEFIQRLTAAAVRLAVQAADWPARAYGDYAAAAQAWGLRRDAAQAGLRWCAELDSPDGRSGPVPRLDALICLDRAYGPLRLCGSSAWRPADLERVFQLFTPNKALGLCGVRGAYAIAPVDQGDAVALLRALEPSWVLGAQGLAMLEAWCLPSVQGWLTDSLPGLVLWRALLVERLTALGFSAREGSAPFVCVRLPEGVRLGAGDLWGSGMAVRDAASFGLPGHWRLNGLGPEAQDALCATLSSSLSAP